MAKFPPAIERWRSLVARYFPPEEVERALWVIQHENQPGDPRAIGDGGASVGLFQLNDNGVGAGMSREARMDAETNIKAAAKAFASQGWKPWGGEGNTFKGKPFGAFGNNASSAGGGGSVPGSAFDHPISQGYGPTDEPLDSGYKGAAHFNKGIDYAAPLGTPVPAMVAGTVIQAGHGSDGWGTSVKVRDAKGFVHNYGHLSGVNVKVGDTISAGQLVGKSGNTGASTGPHLSYDVLSPDGEYIDPSPFVGGAVNGRADTSSGISFEGGGGSDVPNTQAGDALARIRELIEGRAKHFSQNPGIDSDQYADWLTGLEYMDGLIQTELDIRKVFGTDASGQSTDPAQQDFENRVKQQASSLAFDNTNLSRSAQDINRFLSGQAESRNRAQLGFDAKKHLTEWGTAPGKSSYSLNDTGKAFGDVYSKLLGVNADDSFVNYSGTQRVDPMGDMALGDQLLGVQGAIPGVPNLVTAPGQTPAWMGATVPRPPATGTGQSQASATGWRQNAPFGISGSGAGSGLGAALTADTGPTNYSLNRWWNQNPVPGIDPTTLISPDAAAEANAGLLNAPPHGRSNIPAWLLRGG